MPDHLHLLVEGQSEDAELIAFAKDVKQRIAFHYLRDHDGPSAIADHSADVGRQDQCVPVRNGTRDPGVVGRSRKVQAADRGARTAAYHGGSLAPLQF